MGFLIYCFIGLIVFITSFIILKEQKNNFIQKIAAEGVDEITGLGFIFCFAILSWPLIVMFMIIYHIGKVFNYLINNFVHQNNSNNDNKNGHPPHTDLNNFRVPPSSKE
jgi:hypothetical protein